MRFKEFINEDKKEYEYFVIRVYKFGHEFPLDIGTLVDGDGPEFDEVRRRAKELRDKYKHPITQELAEKIKKRIVSFGQLVVTNPHHSEKYYATKKGYYYGYQMIDRVPQIRLLIKVKVPTNSSIRQNQKYALREKILSAVRSLLPDEVECDISDLHKFSF